MTRELREKHVHESTRVESGDDAPICVTKEGGASGRRGAEGERALPPQTQMPTTRGPNPLGSIQRPHLPTAYDPSPSVATNLAPCARSITIGAATTHSHYALRRGRGVVLPHAHVSMPRRQRWRIATHPPPPRPVSFDSFLSPSVAPDPPPIPVFLIHGTPPPFATMSFFTIMTSPPQPAVIAYIQRTHERAHDAGNVNY